MLGFVSKLTDKLLYAMKTDDDKLFERLISDAREAEKTTDILEHKINTYLTQMTHGNLSSHAVAQTVALFDLTNSIESMGDCGEKVAKILEKFRKTNPPSFSEQDLRAMESMAKQAKRIIKNTRLAILQFPNPQAAETASMFKTAVKNEDELNAMRKALRNERNTRISQGQPATPESITAYGDVLNSFERMGDYAMRITETVLRMKAPDKGDLNALSGLPSGPKAQPLG